jgi:hypothetical protein
MCLNRITEGLRRLISNGLASSVCHQVTSRWSPSLIVSPAGLGFRALRLSDCLIHLFQIQTRTRLQLRVTGLDTAAMSAPHTDQKLRASIGANVLVQGKGDCHTPHPTPPSPYWVPRCACAPRACACVCVHVHTISHHAQTRSQPCATQRCWMGGGDQHVVAMG